MNRLASVALTGLPLFATCAVAAETPLAPSNMHSQFFVCIASPVPNGKLFYASRVFEDPSNAGQSQIEDAFRRYLTEKYDYPKKLGRIECPGGSTAKAMEEVKKDRIRQMAAVETDWSPGA